METETKLPRLQALVTPEQIDKMKRFYESGDLGKKSLADLGIDKLLRAYLQDCKYEGECKSMATAQTWLETAISVEKEKGCENWAMEKLLERFKEYRELKEKNKTLEDQKEKDKIKSTLKARNLLEI